MTQTTIDWVEWLRDNAPPGPLGMNMVRVAAKIERLSDALLSISIGDIHDPQKFAADVIQDEQRFDWVKDKAP
jgi:hypothetical protein